jgi:hypothetical protein
MKPLGRIKSDWKWGTSDGNRKLDRILDGQLTFREKLEWLEEAETLSLHLRANREQQSNRKRSRRNEDNSKAQPSTSQGMTVRVKSFPSPPE